VLMELDTTDLTWVCQVYNRHIFPNSKVLVMFSHKAPDGNRQ
jgi:hypothetical protein